MQRGSYLINLETYHSRLLAIKKKKFEEKSESEKKFIIKTRKKRQEEKEKIFSEIRREGKEAFRFLIEENKKGNIYAKRVIKMLEEFKNPFIKNKLKLYREAIRIKSQIEYTNLQNELAIDKMMDILELDEN